jgi:hypothetical protein
MARSSDNASRFRGGLATRAALALVRAYQLLISPLLGPHCRFQPTCSTYAHDALERHGLARGSLLTVRRLARCHPIGFLGGGQGFDPVPGAERPVNWLAPPAPGAQRPSHWLAPPAPGARPTGLKAPHA